MDTVLTIRDIFYSGEFAFNGDAEAITEISFLVDERYLLFDQIKIADKKEYLTLTCEIATKHTNESAAGGGHSHMALKVLAGSYLQKERGQKPQFEQPFCGYFPDVLCEDRLIVVECGHTQNPLKMLAYFRQGNIQEFIQIPYPDEHENAITGFVFAAGEQLIEFLDYLDKSRRNELRESLRRRDS
ncbi:hypothetical protein HY418_01105 [Candidatus Kaiserbacteria bacterium]|nr:hypothetical protein [Candidatus Kaiserbacteria bacterium]